MATIHSILKEYWGYTSFRPLQEDIINSILDNKDTLALLPTGGGKSICFQVPAMAREGLCLVVSPLIALMKDQVDALKRKGITAFAIYAGMTRKDVIQILKIAGDSNCKFLYVSPERLETKLFQEYLPSLDIRLIAVDEAHCISQWGYDFRPPYLRIAALREELPDVPILALTASATPIVQDDIMAKLEFNKPAVYRQSFARPNLSYSAFNADSKLLKIVDILSKVAGSSIVYCKTRKRTRDVTAQLQSYNINADFFHAGLSPEERSTKQEAWIQNKIRTIVCTNAFGMGIDKPDVRVVIHMDSPDCLENYYQEAGRAGRDRNKAYAVLLFQQQDITNLLEQVNIKFPEIEAIRMVYQAVVNYLQIPSGIGEGSYYAFDLQDFVDKFKLDTLLVINSLKVLEQQGFVSFNEQVFLPSKVEFVCNKETLYQFEQSYPDLEPLVKALLRSYEGIFDRLTGINEKSLAFLLRQEIELTKKHLKTLDNYAIIDYQPQKDSPQLFFLQNRIKAEDLRIDSKLYAARKEDYKKRITAFIGYIKSTDCRSELIAKYFGDQSLEPCGVCDNCLNKKKTDLSLSELSTVRTRILAIIADGPIDVKSLLLQLDTMNKDKAWQAIDFLQAEGQIILDEAGKIGKPIR